jgi:hypothetical protein
MVVATGVLAELAVAEVARDDSGGDEGRAPR